MTDLRASASPTPGRIVVLGGSGFVGRALARELADRLAEPPIYILHRGQPSWLADAPVEARAQPLEPDTLRRSLEGCGALVNLLRPDGAGWHANLLNALSPAIAAAGVGRYIHASSIDVYGAAPGERIDEDTPPLPDTAYAREHLAAERAALETVAPSIVLRLGAIFGPGGRNVTSFAAEARAAPAWRLAARRMLYARRRMHLVSLEAVCAVIGQLIGAAPQSLPTRMLVTDDDDERNNFAFLQDVLAKAFARADLRGLPMLPLGALETALRLRGRPAELVRRRFSSQRMRALGLKRPDFAERLEAYAGLLAAEPEAGP